MGREGEKKEKLKERGGKKEKIKVSQHDLRSCSFRRKLGLKGKNFRGAKLIAKRDKNNEHFQTLYFIFGI